MVREHITRFDFIDRTGQVPPAGVIAVCMVANDEVVAEYIFLDGEVEALEKLYLLT